MLNIEKITNGKMPTHVAIIMDGNGRWAKQRGLERVFGHQEGLAAVRRTIETAARLEVSFITLYTFSTENWNRPEEEVKALMSLMVKAVAEETDNLIKNNVRLKVIGDIDRLPKETLNALNSCLEKTSQSTGTTIILALSYSSKWELTEAIKRIAADIQTQNIQPGDIEESTIDSYLSTQGIPNPDLLIRTGGEKRVSNFLLWQIAYSELYFTDELWPDFNETSLCNAIADYQMRERRFGKTSEQIEEEKK